MDGIIAGVGVTVSDPASMVLHVAAGTALFSDVVVSVTGGTVTVGAADATNPRVDIVALDSDGTYEVIAGVAAADPVPASLGGDMEIAYVYVPAGATTIVDHNVGDRRGIVSNIPIISQAAPANLTDSSSGVADATLDANPTVLTDNTTGTPGATLIVSRTDTAAHVAADMDTNFASLNAQLNAVAVVLRDNIASLNAQVNALSAALVAAKVLH